MEVGATSGSSASFAACPFVALLAFLDRDVVEADLEEDDEDDRSDEDELISLSWPS
jgi:hypothetical protein